MKLFTYAGPSFNCCNIECIRKRRFLQKYCSLDNIVCALCRQQADIERASLDADNLCILLLYLFIVYFLYVCMFFLHATITW